MVQAGTSCQAEVAGTVLPGIHRTPVSPECPLFMPYAAQRPWVCVVSGHLILVSAWVESCSCHLHPYGV